MKLLNQAIKLGQKLVQQGHLTEEQLEKMLQAEGSSIEIYKETIRNQILIQKVVSYEVANRLTISNRALKKYYRKRWSVYLLETYLQNSGANA